MTHTLRFPLALTFTLVAILLVLPVTAAAPQQVIDPADGALAIAMDPTCPTDAAINLVKTVNGEDANDPTGPEIVVGSDVVYSYTITNNGLVPLSGILILDDTLGTICKAAELAPGASMTCAAKATALEGQQVNRAKAGATCVMPGKKKVSVKDTDYAYYLGVAEQEPTVPVCLVAIGNYYGDPANDYRWVYSLAWNLVTGELTGHDDDTPPSIVTGSVTPPALFDTTEFSTLSFKSENPNADGCASGRMDYALVAAWRLPGMNEFEGQAEQFCSGESVANLGWRGVFTEGPCDDNGDAVAPAGIGPKTVQ